MPARPPWRDRHPLTVSALLSGIVSVGAAVGVIWAGINFFHTDDEAAAHERRDRMRAMYQDRRLTALEARFAIAQAAACRAWRRPVDICAGHDEDARNATARIGEINRMISEAQK